MNSHLEAKLSEEMGELAARLGRWLLSEGCYGKPRRAATPDPTFENWDPGYVKITVTHFLNRMQRSLQAIVRLVETGFSIEAHSILRSAIESTIDLGYISTNPTTLATKWMLFEDVLRYKHLRTERDSVRPPDYGDIERAVLERLRLMNEHVPRKKPWKLSDLAADWDQSTLARRYEATEKALGDCGQAWYPMYRLLCTKVHGGHETLRDFVQPDGRGNYIYALEPQCSHSVFVGVLSLLAFQSMLDAAQLCGAQLDMSSLAADWSTIGVSRESLIEAATKDFDVVGR